MDVTSSTMTIGAWNGIQISPNATLHRRFPQRSRPVAAPQAARNEEIDARRHHLTHV